MKIVRKLLTATEISPADQRWDETCDCPQTTPDNGTTWNDAPGLDTRHADNYRNPALTTADPQCDAAANMVAQVRASVDLIVSRGSLVGAASSLLALWLLAVGPVGWLIDLLVIGLEALLAIGVIAIDAAFTEGVYDDLLCIFYCNSDVDGQISAEQFANILTAIDGMDSVVNATLDVFFNVWGEVGLSNAGSTGSETGDCSGCTSCDQCYEWGFYSEAFSGFPVCSVGLYIDDHLAQDCVGGDSSWNVGRGLGATPVQVTRVEMDMQLVFAALPTDWYIYGLASDTGDCGGDQVLLASGTLTATGTVGVDISPTDCYGFQLISSTSGGCGASDCYLFAFRIFSPNLADAGLTPNC